VQIINYYSNYLSYNWYGPGSISYPNASSIYTSVAGLYYCSVIDTNGCELWRNIIEVFEYATPNVFATPDSILCSLSDSVVLNASSSLGGVVQ